MVVLPATDSTGAENMALQLQQALAKKEIHHEASEAASHLTFSMGIASLPPSDKRTSIEKLMEYADFALYRAKEKGRNQYSVWGED